MSRFSGDKGIPFAAWRRRLSGIFILLSFEARREVSGSELGSRIVTPPNIVLCDCISNQLCTESLTLF
jgi:hypothetical protein